MRTYVMGWSLVLPALFAASIASAGTLGADFSKSVRKKAPDLTAVPRPNVKKANCVCNDVGSPEWYQKAGVLLSELAPDGFGNQYLEVTCQVVLFPVDPSSEDYDLIQCEPWLPIPPK